MCECTEVFNFEEILQNIQRYYSNNKRVYVDIAGHDEKKRIIIIDYNLSQKMNNISCSICGSDVLKKNDKEYYPEFVSFIFNDGQDDMKKLILFKENKKYILCGKKTNTCKFFDMEFHDIYILKDYDILNQNSFLDIFNTVTKEFNF